MKRAERNGGHSSARPRGRTLLVLALLATLGSDVGGALDFEVAPVGAYRFGGIEIPVDPDCRPLLEDCPEAIETKDSFAWGLTFALLLREPWWVDVRFSQQSASADFSDRLETSSFDADWQRYLVGLERRFREEATWRPFFAVAAGWSDVSAELPAVEAGTLDLDRVTVEAGSGLLVDRGRVGLRFEARVSWTPLPSELGDDLVQVGVGAGFRLRRSTR